MDYPFVFVDADPSDWTGDSLHYVVVLERSAERAVFESLLARAIPFAARALTIEAAGGALDVRIEVEGTLRIEHFRRMVNAFKAVDGRAKLMRVTTLDVLPATDAWTVWSRAQPVAAPSAEVRHRVRLVAVGANLLATIQAIKAITNGGMAEARALARPDSVVLETESPYAARAAISRLEKAGATVAVAPPLPDLDYTY